MQLSLIITNTCKLRWMERIWNKQSFLSKTWPVVRVRETLGRKSFRHFIFDNQCFQPCFILIVLYLMINFFHLGPLLSSVSAGAANLHLVGLLLCQPRLKMQTLVLAIWVLPWLSDFNRWSTEQNLALNIFSFKKDWTFFQDWLIVWSPSNR